MVGSKKYNFEIKEYRDIYDLILSCLILDVTNISVYFFNEWRLAADKEIRLLVVLESSPYLVTNFVLQKSQISLYTQVLPLRS